MNNKITILGAGMAGLLAGAILRTDVSEIWEAQESLPNNHSALLRFRSSIVGDALNIPFKKVQVMKASDKWRNPVADALSYSLKTNGIATLRSSTTAQGEIDERFIAPPDLIQQMADRVQAPIRFGTTATRESLTDSKGPIISTLPMPVLAKIIGFTNELDTFRWVEGFNINVQLKKVDAYVTIYVPDRDKLMNRISITGDRLTIECACPHLTSAQVTNAVNHRTERPNHFEIEDCLELLGLPTDCFDHTTIEVKQQRYAKILPIDDGWRKRFIVRMSDQFGIYSLGRFATWRPSLLLDDLVNDVRVIKKIISNGAYDQLK